MKTTLLAIGLFLGIIIFFLNTDAMHNPSKSVINTTSPKPSKCTTAHENECHSHWVAHNNIAVYISCLKFCKTIKPNQK